MMEDVLVKLNVGLL